MLYSELNFIDLSIKLIELKIQAEPSNILHRAIHAALDHERRGETKAALKIYSSFATDPFANKRMKFLSRSAISTLSDGSIRLTNLMSIDEADLFRAIKQLRDNGETLTRDALIKATQFPKHKVLTLMESLKGKGYISKFERHYYRLVINNHPVEVNGLMGMPQKPNSIEENLPSNPQAFSKELVHSLRNCQASPYASPIALDDNSEEDNCTTSISNKLS